MAKVVTDINKRWEDGMDHHPESLQLMKEMKEVDKKNGYAFSELLETGGDGDEGENLLYLMDVCFEQRDQKRK